MKTVSSRKFYADTSLVDELTTGDQLVVTAGGKTKFIVTKAGKPRMTRELASRRAVGDPKRPTFDGAAFLKSLKK
ncbi:MAG: hypothetical protein IPK32_22715 [Verrucomicrobiaceae bacterium]|nr:hypothetical protein [Verrucomicrobiaceae bacterium]